MRRPNFKLFVYFFFGYCASKYGVYIAGLSRGLNCLFCFVIFIFHYPLKRVVISVTNNRFLYLRLSVLSVMVSCVSEENF